MIPNIHSQTVDGIWTVTNFVGEEWFCSKEEIINQTQEFYKGWSEGVFYECDYSGQSMTYNKYSLSELLKNPEFELFKKYKDSLYLKEDDFFVHRITCNGDSDKNKRRVFYPFITTSNLKKSFYIYEGGIFVLEYFIPKNE